MNGWDAAAWLREFEAVGGSVETGSDGRLRTSYPIHGSTIADQRACCCLLTKLSADPRRVSAVRLRLLARP